VKPPPREHGRNHLSRKAGFEQIYNATYRKTLTYVLRRTLNTADAQDVVAETYLVAWRRLDQLLGADEPQAWLYAVAYRTLGNLRRTNQRQENVAAKASLVHADGSDADPAHSVEAQDQLGRVTLAMAQLSERDQEVLRLAAYEELDRAAIGVVLGVRAVLVGTLLYRARRRLEEALARVPMRPNEQAGHKHDAGEAEQGPRSTQVQHE
jgi:RNA polymerase sigma factor (sigma-70 family)